MKKSLYKHICKNVIGTQKAVEAHPLLSLLLKPHTPTYPFTPTSDL